MAENTVHETPHKNGQSAFKISNVHTYFGWRMDKNIRLFWAYDHPTARYQEVNLFIDSGLEVVVGLGDPSTLRFDKSYHDETDPLYPDWRSSLTLPSSIVERLRRIDLFRNSGHVSPENAELINSLIDIMIIPADAPVISVTRSVMHYSVRLQALIINPH